MASSSHIILLQWKSHLICTDQEIWTDQAPLQAKTVQNNSKQTCQWILMWEDNRGWNLSWEELGSIIMGYGLKQCFKVKMSQWWICLTKTNTQLFTSQGIHWFTCALLWCLGSHSDGTHSLQRIHWWASDAMLNFSKSVQMKKKLIYILDGLRVSIFKKKKIHLLGKLFFMKPSNNVRVSLMTIIPSV